MRPFVRLLIRPRRLWLPTGLGGLLLVLLLGAASVIAARHAHHWLAVDEAARGPDGRGSRTLVVEGWLNPFELDRAAQVFREGRYDRIVTTGGPNFDWPEAGGPPTYAERAAGYLVRHGVPADRVVAASAPATAQDRTYRSAVAVREWGLRSQTPLPAIDVFTGGMHARRSRMVYRMAFGDAVEVGALTARPVQYDPDRWWTSSEGAKSVLAESVSLAWTVCCFWPTRPTDADAAGGPSRQVVQSRSPPKDDRH